MMVYFIGYLSFETWALIGSLLLLVRYYINRKWSVLSNLNIPHDPPSILQFGHARKTLSNDIFNFDRQQKEKHGQIYGCYEFLRSIIVCHDLEILKKIFITEFSTFPNRMRLLPGMSGEELANSLLETRDKHWKRIRKTMTPTFSTSKLRQMCEIVDWCVNNTVAVFKKGIETENGVFTAKDVFLKLSLDVICSSAFSTDVNSQDALKKEPLICLNAKKLVAETRSDPTVIFSILFPRFGSTLYNVSRRKPLLQFFHSVCDKIMQQRNEKSSLSNRVDLLQLMLDSKVDKSELNKDCKKGMSEIEIIGNSVFMIMAGYETTSTVMTFLAYNLAQHPEVQRKLLSEIDEMYKTKNSLDYDTVNRLQYLDMCINESIRLYTPVPKTYRTGNKDVTLNGLTIPRNMLVAMPIYSLCHDTEYWENPMEFNPERMKNMDEMHPMLFQPFGSGPRNCIGMRFALMEVKVAFCKLLHEFTFEPTPDTPKPPLELVTNVVTIASKINFNLRIVPRVNPSNS